MTDRINAFVVVLEHDIRDDDAAATINAIKQIKGVLDVQPTYASPDTMIAEMRARSILVKKLWDVLRGKDE